MRGTRRGGRSALRALLVAFAIVAAGVLPTPARATTPALILAPERGQYRGDCTGAEAGIAIAIGRDFPEGAGIAIYAMRAEGLPFERGNIRTLLGTVVVRDGRFVDSYLGLRTLLCWRRADYPDGTRIAIVAADTARFNGDTPRADAARARAVFTVDSRAPFPATQRCFAATLLCARDRFHDHWAATGGLARHGYPLTDERRVPPTSLVPSARMPHIAPTATRSRGSAATVCSSIPRSEGSSKHGNPRSSWPSSTRSRHRPPSGLVVRGRNRVSGTAMTFENTRHQSEYETEWGTNYVFPEPGCWELRVDEQSVQRMVTILVVP